MNKAKAKKNRAMNSARRNKNNEFYTQRQDIEAELEHYTDHFKDKVVYCNCDDPNNSRFFFYFSRKFKQLGIKKLITTCYQSDNWEMFSKHDKKTGIYLEYKGTKNADGIHDKSEVIKKPLQGDGDFQSDECVEILKTADIVVTNPPFSLFKEYVAQLVEHNKKFLIIGNLNAVKYKPIFKLIQEDRIWLGINNGAKEYMVSKEYAKEFPDKISRVDGKGNPFTKMGNTGWFTNLDIDKRHEDIALAERYSEVRYPKYDNYDAIEVSALKEIPRDYDGYMGVPITFIERYNPAQFKIFGFTNTKEVNKGIRHEGSPNGHAVLNGKIKYSRILIKRRK